MATFECGYVTLIDRLQVLCGGLLFLQGDLLWIHFNEFFVGSDFKQWLTFGHNGPVTTVDDNFINGTGKWCWNLVEHLHHFKDESGCPSRNDLPL